MDPGGELRHRQVRTPQVQKSDQGETKIFHQNGGKRRGGTGGNVPRGVAPDFAGGIIEAADIFKSLHSKIIFVIFFPQQLPSLVPDD